MPLTSSLDTVVVAVLTTFTVGAGVLLLHKARTPEAREVFTRYRATASARAMESIGWAGFHAVCCLGSI